MLRALGGRLVLAAAVAMLWTTAMPGAADTLTGSSSRFGASLGAAGVAAPADTPPICISACGDPSTTRASIVCTPVTRPHFEAIYVTPPGGVDRSADLVEPFQHSIYQASAYLDARARTEGGRARYPMLCDQHGAALVHVMTLAVQVPPVPGFEQIVSALEKRFHSRLAKYIVYYDGCEAELLSGCPAGQSTWHIDDKAGRGNANNYGPSFSIDYGGQSPQQGPDWYTILHESTHALGAVQLSAPHSDGNSHCTDAADTMCGLASTTAWENGQLAPSCGSYLQITTATYVYDCHADDYFNVHPRRGSYLATHWNIAARYNQFVVHD